MSNSTTRKLDFHVMSVTLFSANCILVTDPASRDTVIVDPGGEPDRIAREIRARNLKPVAICLTHGHVDHVSGATSLKQTFQVPVYLHPGDRLLASQVPMQCRMFGIPVEKTPEVDHPLDEGQLLSLGSVALRVLHTPGHSPGSVCFLAEQDPPVLLSGDLLFAGSIGRTDLPGGNGEAMMQSLRRVSEMEPRMKVIPGHGPATTIGSERRSNPFINNGIYI